MIYDTLRWDRTRRSPKMEGLLHSIARAVACLQWFEYFAAGNPTYQPGMQGVSFDFIYLRPEVEQDLGEYVFEHNDVSKQRLL